MEAIYDDIAPKIGFVSFAPIIPARGSMFTASHRSARTDNPEPVVPESELYGK
jgi:hypothetical protein